MSENSTNDFTRTVRPGRVQAYATRKVNVFCKVEYKAGRLSITGVVGPYQSGNAAGGCGQINPVKIDELAPAWTRDMLARFNDVWAKWHLNDMRAACEHQRAEGWGEQAREQVTLYHFTLTDEALKLKKATEGRAVEALKAGETFQPTEEESRLANLPYSVTHHEPNLEATLGLYYRPKRSLYAGDKAASETKTRGWLRASEHPQGLLSKPCPVCGYKYGTAWLREEVPAEVLDFLRSLPTTDITPAWV